MKARNLVGFVAASLVLLGTASFGRPNQAQSQVEEAKDLLRVLYLAPLGVDGGRLRITTWHEDLDEPPSEVDLSVLSDEACDVHPDRDMLTLHLSFHGAQVRGIHAEGLILEDPRPQSGAVVSARREAAIRYLKARMPLEDVQSSQVVPEQGIERVVFKRTPGRESFEGLVVFQVGTGLLLRAGAP